MDCALWLNRKKISAASEISDNLDIASLRGYFLAGSLIPWLEEHGGKHYAKRFAALSHDDPMLNGKIAQIFGGKAGDSAPYKTLDGNLSEVIDFSINTNSITAALTSFNIGSAGSYNYAAISSFGSFYAFLQSFTGTESNSFKLREYITSYSSSSSFILGKWEWLWSLLFGSSSFTTSGGSFAYGWEWLWNLLFGGSSSFTTSGGSFTYGWEWLWNLLFGGSSSFTTSGGSFAYGWEWLWNLLFGGSSSFTASGGSFTYGWEWLWQLLFGGRGSFNSFDWNGFGFGSFGSFGFSLFDAAQNAEAENLPALPQFDEYDLILLKTLISCPLDRFGYGIHNI